MEEQDAVIHNQKQEIDDLKAKVAITNAMNDAAKTLMYRMAKEYGVDKDLDAILGYKEVLTFEDYWIKYQRNEIGAAVIDRISDTSFRGGFDITQGEDDDETEFERDWAAINTEHDFMDVFERADVLGLVGRYAGILLGFNDVTSANDNTKPVSGKVELIFMKALSETSMEIATVNKDSADPRYGLPELYKVKIPAAESISPTTYVEDTAFIELTVHWTRVIHVAYKRTENEVFGTPALKSVYNRLEDLEKLVGGAAEMFWRGARPGYQGILDENTQITDDGQKRIAKEVEKFEKDFTRLFINKGIELKALAPQVEDPTGHYNMLIEGICAAKGIPKRVLMGSERGELASSQDRSTWFETIDSRRVREPEKRMIRPLITRLVDVGILPYPGDDDYNVEWADLASESMKDKVDIAAVLAKGLKDYLDSGADELMPVNIFFSRLGFTEQEIGEIESSYEEMLKKEEQMLASQTEPGAGGPGGGFGGNQ